MLYASVGIARLAVPSLFRAANFTAPRGKLGMGSAGRPRAAAKMALTRLEEGLLLSIPVRERPETKCSKGCIITGIDEA